MTEKKITKKQVISALRKVIAENGGSEIGYADVYSRLYNTDNREYGSCEYVIKGTPACIVGQTMPKFGIDPATLMNTVWSGAESHPTERFTPGANAALRAAQRAQDTGETWGAALVYAQDSRVF